MKIKTEINIKTLADAIRLLKQLGIQFDNAYQVEFGLHIYFNQGENLNVAWYTPITEILVYYPEGGRYDATSYAVRIKKSLDICE